MRTGHQTCDALGVNGVGCVSGSLPTALNDAGLRSTTHRHSVTALIWLMPETTKWSKPSSNGVPAKGTIAANAAHIRANSTTRPSPTGALLTTKTAPWRFEDWMVMVGDSAHAVYPFYGQGMNSAFEDCSALLSALKANATDRARAFSVYEQSRRPQTDVLMELSKANFVELRQKVSSPWFLARKRLDVALNRLMPKVWLPIYTMVSHTTMPYAEALARARKQDRILGTSAAAVAALAIGMGAWWASRS